MPEWVGTMGVLAESVSAVSASAANSAHQSSQSGECFSSLENIFFLSLFFLNQYRGLFKKIYIYLLEETWLSDIVGQLCSDALLC